MTYRIEFTRRAARDLERFDRRARLRIVEAVAGLGIDPRPAGVKKLKGEDNAWRIRVGDYRVIYEIHDNSVLIVVFRVGHRRDIYT